MTGESSFVPASPCHVGIGLLALRSDTLFTPAPKRDRSFYLFIYEVTQIHEIGRVQGEREKERQRQIGHRFSRRFQHEREGKDVCIF